MKFVLFFLFSLPLLSTPILSHGSKEDCSTECNDYYCPPEMKKDKDGKYLRDDKLDT